MARMHKHHQVLNDRVGKCSVPMWSGDGLPAGFCDEPAYGTPPPGRTLRSGDGSRYREDGLYAGYAPALACLGHGGPVGPPGVRVFKDGSAWCAVGERFVNIQESPCGFGESKSEAVSELMESLVSEKRPPSPPDD